VLGALWWHLLQQRQQACVCLRWHLVALWEGLVLQQGRLLYRHLGLLLGVLLARLGAPLPAPQQEVAVWNF
jgi:hypothetical protein